MGINIRTKGAGGEREVADAMNYVVYKVMKELGMPNPTMSAIQRNQLQTAVGGNDLTGCFGLSIEVKRQEQLSINTWWEQCKAAASRNGEQPVLLYRQNGKRWHAVLMCELPLSGSGAGSTAWCVARCEISWEDFLKFFEEWVRRKFALGYTVKL